jgi:hypothetical protein
VTGIAPGLPLVLTVRGLVKTVREDLECAGEPRFKPASDVCPDARDIVGFATETARGSEGSEDAVYLDARDWDSSMEAKAKDLQNLLGILTNPTEYRSVEPEYPE